MSAAIKECSEKQKILPKIKVPKIINTIVSKIRLSSSSPKLATDAVAISGPCAVSSPPSLNNSTNRINSLDPWQNVIENERVIVGSEVASVNNNATANSNQMLTPSMGHSTALLSNSPVQNRLMPNTFNNMNNTMMVNHFDTQNNYNFSQITGLHIGSVIQVGVPASQQESRSRKVSRGDVKSEDGSDGSSNSASPYRKTKSIVGKLKTPFLYDSMVIFGFNLLAALMESTEPLEYKTMNLISEHMGENWRFTLRQLGYSDGQIDQKFEEYRNVKETIYRFLLDSSRNDEITIGKLARIMWKESNQRECVFILKEHMKTKAVKNPRDDENSHQDNDADPCVEKPRPEKEPL